jgi:endoglucanase
MKTLRAITTILILICSINSLALDTPEYQEPLFSYDFCGLDALTGWSTKPEPYLVTTTGDDYLLMKSVGSYDAKLYRTINLPKGRYSCTITSADNIRVQISDDDWSASGYDIYLNAWRNHDFIRTYSFDFEAPGGNAYLCILVGSSDVECKIKSLEIAPVNSYTFIKDNNDYTQRNWIKTATATLTAGFSSLKIDASGTDAKVYRNVALEAQNYTVSAIGENVYVILRQGWDPADVKGQVILGNSRINNGTFNVNIPTAGTYTLVAKVNGGNGASGEIKGITIKPLLHYQFDYSGCSTDGWTKTSAATLTEETDSLTIDSSSWDGKIYRSIKLPPEEYILTITARGNTRLLLRPDWSTTYLSETVSSSPTIWETQSFYFKSESSSSFNLVMKVDGGPGSSCEIKNIRIERAPMNLYQHPYELRGWMARWGWADVAGTGANFARIEHHPTSDARNIDSTADDLFDPELFDQVLDLLESRIKDAEENGQTLVIDLHEIPHNPNKTIDNDDDTWNDPDVTDMLCTYWQKVAQRLSPYVASGTIIGYDLLNEPYNRDHVTGFASKWRDIAQEIVATIRAIDKNVWIIYEPGPGGLSTAMEYTKPLADHKVIYSFHFYEPFEYTHQNVANSLAGNAESPDHMESYPDATKGWDKDFLRVWLRFADGFQARYQVPIYVGEFSTVKWADGAGEWFEDTIDVLEERNWIWTVHSWRSWQGWNHEYNNLYYKAGDMNSLHELDEAETSLRLEAIEDSLANNP